MRIAVVATSYPADVEDPAGHFVRTEVRSLEAAGHEVVLIVPAADNDAFGWPGALSRLAARPGRSLDAARFALDAARALARARADRVIAHWIVPSAWPIALGCDAPLEIVVHGSDVGLLERLPRRMARYVMQTLLARGAELRFVSSELRDRLAAKTGLDFGAHSRVEPAAIDVSQAPSRTQARLELGLTERARVALVMARLVPEKRVEVALSAASLLDASVVVVGDGPQRESLERDFPDARFVGKLPRRRALAWLAASDVLVSASRREGAPTAIREARALAVPVVTTTAGDLQSWAELDPELYVVD